MVSIVTKKQTISSCPEFDGLVFLCSLLFLVKTYLVDLLFLSDTFFDAWFILARTFFNNYETSSSFLYGVEVITAVSPVRNFFLVSLIWTAEFWNIYLEETFSKLKVESQHTARMGERISKELPVCTSNNGEQYYCGESSLDSWTGVQHYASSRSFFRRKTRLFCPNGKPTVTSSPRFFFYITLPIFLMIALI